MIKHIVMWKLTDQVNGKDKASNTVLLRTKLEAPTRTMPRLLDIKVEIDFLAVN